MSILIRQIIGIIPWILFFAFVTIVSRYYFNIESRDIVEIELEAILLRENANPIPAIGTSDVYSKFENSELEVFGTLTDGELGLLRSFVMIYGARSVGNTIPWVLFIPTKKGQNKILTENTKAMAAYLGVKIHFMDWIEVPSHFEPGQSNWAFSWQKMSIWKFDQYKKIVLVDSDTFFQKSANEMIDFKDFTYSTGTCDRPCYEYFWEMNAGVIVFKPNPKMFDELLQYAENHKSPTNYRYVEQDLLWLYYTKNQEKPSYHMSNLYNMCILWCNSKCLPDPLFEKVVVIGHFVCMEGQKPWNYPKKSWGEWSCGGRWARKWYNRLDSMANLVQVIRWD